MVLDYAQLITGAFSGVLCTIILGGYKPIKKLFGVPKEIDEIKKEFKLLKDDVKELKSDIKSQNQRFDTVNQNITLIAIRLPYNDRPRLEN